MKRIQLEHFGPIEKADITLGDLTVLVGPQASGKSLFVQLLKAIRDAGAIRTELKSHGFDWLHGGDVIRDYCRVYFGGGLEGVADGSHLRVDGKARPFKSVAKPGGRANQAESTFLIPAQRVLVLQDGWPKPFMAYSQGDPYCLRHFSEAARLLMEDARDEAIFPHTKRLKAELKQLIDESIYVGGKLLVDRSGPRKRIVLSPGAGQSALPFGAWSAGQREFTPLLLGLYWLLPPAKVPRRGAIDTVIIEEPEMGLHPQAIVAFGLFALELLQRGYRVILSTHSPAVLDLVWALGLLRECQPATADGALRDIFGLKALSPQIRAVFRAAFQKDIRTHFFERNAKGVVVRDISSLDPGSDDVAIAGWGGLSGFSGHTADIVGAAIAEVKQ